MINFEEIEIIKEIGAGVNGTTYLVKYKNKDYAMKIQHILDEDRIVDFNKALWRELEPYNYIETLKKEDQYFFARLYGYNIYDQCKHIQKRFFRKKKENKKRPPRRIKYMGGGGGGVCKS